MKLKKCDHCGAIIENETHKTAIQTVYHENRVRLLLKDKEATFPVNYDLCDSCYDLLLKWLDGSAGSTVSP